MIKELAGASETLRGLIDVGIDSALSSMKGGSAPPSMLSMDQGQIDIAVFQGISFQDFRRTPATLSKEAQAFLRPGEAHTGPVKDRRYRR